MTIAESHALTEARARLKSATEARNTLARVVADLVYENGEPDFIAYMASRYREATEAEAAALQDLVMAREAFDAARQGGRT